MNGLDDLLAAADPARDAPAADGLARLRDEISATDPRRAGRARAAVWGSRAAAAALAAGVIATAGVLAASHVDSGPASPGAVTAPAPADPISTPSVLLAGWRVERVYDAGDDGELDFVKGDARADLHWRPLGQFQDYVDDRAVASRDLGTAPVLGAVARVFRYRDPAAEFTALWRSGGRTWEFRTAARDADAFRALLSALEPAPRDRWIAALPDDAVVPADRSAVVDEMLAGVPAIAGATAAIRSSTLVTDRYSLGAEVVTAVVCPLLDRWLEAASAGDDAGMTSVARTLAGSGRWPVLREMAAEGRYPDAVGEVAARAARGEESLAAIRSDAEGFGCGPGAEAAAPDRP
ncbi:MAG: hypothetical protein AB7V42_13920 [Thermoleophilia bacterium]